ncbi:MAG TPA: sigma-54 dependent transcriptional regulator [Vicinamibacterales bacterium]|nr:sigma-54 dependent transcriptional regulator [Vicinamibacterales bacterium]
MAAHEIPELVGESEPIRELRAEILRVSASDAKVLVTGESGVGKELVAHAIHRHSRRAPHPFVAVNCAGLSETLLESELFGHTRGSFTGAYRDKAGKLEIANRGTLFLDEIGEMTPRMQGMLLRFLETGELQRVGSGVSGRVDVRVVAATNRDLRAMVAEGRFREDLLYRLNVIHLEVPPLRERRVDIPRLVEAFLERAARESLFVPREVSSEALAALVDYSWPGNVRQLENVIEQALVRARSEIIRLEDLPSEVRTPRAASLRAGGERRRTIADDLFRRMREDRESFWVAVYAPYMQREITRDHLREVVRRGLDEARGNYRIVAALFNLPPGDYKRFLNFLRKHDVQLPFKDYRR